MREFRMIKMEYVDEYRKSTLAHKCKVTYYTLAREVVLGQLLSFKQVRLRKLQTSVE